MYWTRFFFNNLKTACCENMNNKIVTFQEMKKYANDINLLIIDVREVKEIKETGLIGKSINIPLPNLNDSLKISNNEFQKRYGRDLPKSDTFIIFTCRSGNRASKALVQAEALGFRNCKVYKGGWLEWSSKQKHA